MTAIVIILLVLLVTYKVACVLVIDPHVDAIMKNREIELEKRIAESKKQYSNN